MNIDVKDIGVMLDLVCINAHRRWIDADPAGRYRLEQVGPGDLVCEATICGGYGYGWFKCFGRIVMMADGYYWIELVDGTLKQWSDCRFTKVHESLIGDTSPIDRVAWVVEALERHKAELTT